MEEWYIGRNGQAIGPLAFKVLLDAAQQGSLNRNDLVWKTGMEAWAPASSVAALWGPPPLPNFVGQTAMHSNVIGPEEGNSEANKQPEASTGTGGKIIMSVVVAVSGTLIAAAIKELVGYGYSFAYLAIVLILFFIWLPPVSPSNVKSHKDG